ncbi:SpoIIE family protein phosphatase [Cellulomonas fimi]|uniref:ATP-binding SpoIIE family protein phosphatase n=1 Tax=Cellulomonas fimi TaxID=1708 RepID=UPI00234D277E|nr:SpoIIE family protein phosphatase [Cellulomonas fimi]MDC7122375.1 SpoIIE family protein phosphatase [Cellulomonas fimi]
MTDPSRPPLAVEATLQAFDGMPVAVAAIREDGVVVAANRTARDFGVGQVLGRPAVETLTDVVGRRMMPRLEQALRTRRGLAPEEVLLEVGDQHRDVWVRLSLAPWLDDDGEYQGMIVMAEDVSAAVEQRLAEEARVAGVEESYEVARDVIIALQGALLPSSVPILPRVDVAATYLVAGREQAAGGDWFDAAVTPDGRVSLTVGDVVGHGVAASAAMSQMRAILASRLLDGAAVVDALASLDRYARVATSAFATSVCVVLLDPKTGALEYATRGHPAPLVVGPTRSRWLPTTGGGPLGIDGGSEVRTARLAEDEALLLFTDGLVELVGRPLDERMQQVVDAAEHAVRGAVIGRYAGRTVAERLCLHVPWALDEGFVDDVTVLAVARRAAPPDLALDVPADAARLADVRGEVDAWARTVGLEPRERAALVLAASEAAANSIEHAYAGTTGGRIRVDARLRRTTVTLGVSDDGAWQAPAPDPGDRGRGLSMVTSSGVRLSVDTGETGTRVEFELDARRRAPVGSPVIGPTAVLTGGPQIDVQDDGVIRVGGVLDTEAAAALVDAEVRSRSRGGVVPVTVEIAPTTFLGSAAVRAIERYVRGADPGAPHVEVVVHGGSAAAQTLAVVGTPVTTR